MRCPSSSAFRREWTLTNLARVENFNLLEELAPAAGRLHRGIQFVI